MIGSAAASMNKLMENAESRNKRVIEDSLFQLSDFCIAWSLRIMPAVISNQGTG
jgi:hypothetical protein